MAGLFVAALLFCFWRVLAPSVVFFAPDAPIEPLTFGESLRRLFTSPPTLQGLVGLFPFGFSYEGTFWVDAGVMCLAGLFLLRSRGLSWGAAWIGGFAAAFAGYFFTLFCAGHRGVVDALAVTCLAFGILFRAIQTLRWRWFASLGLVLAFGLGAQADIWLLVVLAVVAYGGWLAVRERPSAGRLVVGLAGTVLVFLLVGAPALVHTFGTARETRQTQLAQAGAAEDSPEAAWMFSTDWSLPPEELKEWLIPGSLGATSYPFDPNPYSGRMGSRVQVLRQHTIHVGLPALTLAVLACVLFVAGRRKEGASVEPWRRDLLFWLGLASITLVFAFGRFTPVYRAVWQLPFIHEMRAPVKWLHLTGFAVAMLAGCGAEPLLRRAGQGAAVLLCGFVAFWGAWVAKPYVFPWNLDPDGVLSSLPSGTRVCSRMPGLDAWLRSLGLEPVSWSREADVAILGVLPDGSGALHLTICPLKGAVQ